jgi:hypothetical protein
VQAAEHLTGWPFEDDEDYETSDSDEFSEDDDGEEDVSAPAKDVRSADEQLEELEERRRAMPPLEYVAESNTGKCNVALCSCTEEHCRVRQLLCLLHTIVHEVDSCILANACWDATAPEAIPSASQTQAGDTALMDDAHALQLPADCVNALLMHGASPDHCGKDGQTALEAAVQCKNVAAVAALCAYGTDASQYASQEALNGLAFAADTKDKRVGALQVLLKQHSSTGKGSAFEAAQKSSRSAWRRLGVRICWVHNPQVPSIPRNREVAQTPEAALAMPIVQSSQAAFLKPAADFSRVCCSLICSTVSLKFLYHHLQLKYWRLTCSELGDVMACLQRACELPLIHDVSGCALKFLSASGAVILPETEIKSSFREELVQAVVRDVPICITSSTTSVLSQVIAAADSISSLLLSHIKSGMISCNPEIASLLFPVTFESKKKTSQPTRWERILQQILEGSDADSKDGQQPFLPGRCFRCCVSFTMLVILTCPPTAKAIEPKNAAIALECIG